MARESFTKKLRTYVGTFFLVLGIFMATPPFLPVPDDFVNIIISIIITIVFGIPLFASLVLTYTVLAWLFILIGIAVIPKNNKTLFRKTVTKVSNSAKNSFKWMKKNPIFAVPMILFFIILWLFYTLLLIGGL